MNSIVNSAQSHSEISTTDNNSFRNDINRPSFPKFNSPVSNKESPSTPKMNNEDSDPEFEDEEEDEQQQRSATTTNNIDSPHLKSTEEDEEGEYNGSLLSKSPGGATKIRKRGPQSSGSKPKIGKNGKKKECEFCGTADTPMWRRGPTGKGTLCNACGVKWSLKFRKKNSPSKDTGDIKLKKAVKRDLKQDFPVTSPKPRMMMTTTTTMPPPPPLPERASVVMRPCAPFSNEEVMTNNLQEDQEWDCKFCSCSWPANFFKQHEYFGWMCMQCASRHHLMETREEDEFAGQRFKRRRSEDSLASPQSTEFVSEEWSNSSDIDSDDTASRLFGSLLNVVENKLVEVQELEAIKEQFEKWKASVQYNEEQRQRCVDEAQLKITSDLQQFRERVVTLLSTNEGPISGKLGDLHSANTEVCQRTNSMQRDLQEMRALLSKDGQQQQQQQHHQHHQSSLIARLEALEAQMAEVSKITNTTAKVVQPLLSGGLTQVITNQFDATDRKVASEFSQMKHWSQEELNQVKQRMNRIDNILDNKAHSTP